jgi:signal peptidase II
MTGADTKTLSRFAIALLATAGTISCDRVTKQAATAWLEGLPPRSFLADTVRLQYVENTGGFLGLGSGLPPAARFWIFSAGSLALMGVVAALFLKKRPERTVDLLAFGLVLGGGLSNIADRLFRDGHVIDFLNLGLGSLRTGIFNVADVCLLAGAALMLVHRRRDETIPRT